MVVRFKGLISKEEKMPGGSPAGTLLGVLAFIIQMNNMRAIPWIPFSQVITPPGIRQSNTTCKFIDDLTIVSSVNLKQNLQIDLNLERPLVYNSRNMYILPDEKKSCSRSAQQYCQSHK